MSTHEMLPLIEQEVKTLLEKLGAQVQAFSAKEEGTSILVEATLEEPQIFIGENGQTLAEIQHVVRAMLRKKLQEQIWISLDINGYKKSKETYLEEMAASAADEVALLKKEKELPAMSAADRRIIHMAMSKRTDVVSESRGEEPNRRIVLRPA